MRKIGTEKRLGTGAGGRGALRWAKKLGAGSLGEITTQPEKEAAKPGKGILFREKKSAKEGKSGLGVLTETRTDVGWGESCKKKGGKKYLIKRGSPVRGSGANWD